MFGRLYQKDDRDKGFLLKPNFQLARSITRRYWYAGNVLNQGQTPQCVAYSGYKWLTAGPVRNKRLPFTPAELYHQAQLNDEWSGEDYDGTSVRGLFKSLNKAGYVPEYRWAFDSQAVLAYVMTTGPMVLGSTWFSQMSQPNNYGFITPAGAIEGGHAYLIIGANRTKKNSKTKEVGAFRILNSWGREWGQVGRAWMSFSSFDALQADGFTEACVATEVRL